VHVFEPLAYKNNSTHPKTALVSGFSIQWDGLHALSRLGTMLAIRSFGTTLDMTCVSQASAKTGQTNTHRISLSSAVAQKRDLRRVLMTNRRTLTVSIFSAVMLALCLPVLAAAQGTYDPWGRNRDDDYRRDRNGNYGRSGRYDERYVRDSIHRLDRLAKDFERDLDRALDHSRVNGSQREDRINAQGHDFRRAVSALKSSFGNGRDLNRSRDEAQRVLQEARQLDRIGRARGIDNRVASEWSQIQQELRVISDAYGLGYSGGYNDDGYYRNDRRNDDYRRNRTNNNNDWWRRIPWPN
jgi:hypothetical protein